MEIFKDNPKTSVLPWFVGMKFCVFFHQRLDDGSANWAFGGLYSDLIVGESFYQIFIWC